MNVGGGQLPNKSRYGCVASAKPSPGKISQKNLMPGQITAKNLGKFSLLLECQN